MTPAEYHVCVWPRMPVVPRSPQPITMSAAASLDAATIAVVSPRADWHIHSVIPSFAYARKSADTEPGAPAPSIQIASEDLVHFANVFEQLFPGLPAPRWPFACAFWCSAAWLPCAV